MNIILLLLVIVSSTSVPDVRFLSGRESGPEKGQSKSKSHEPSATTDAKQNADAQSDCGCKGAAPPAILAIVNGAKIAARDIDDRIADRIKELEQEAVEARKDKLRDRIDSKLFAHEAKRRRITVAQLMNEEVFAKIKEPTESEALSFYNENKSSIPVSFEVAKRPIINHLRNRRKFEGTRGFADSLRSRIQVKVLIENPSPPRSLTDRALVLATVDNEPIMVGEVEDVLRPVTLSIQDRIYDLRKKELDLRINSLLLQQEATKRGLTVEELLRIEVASKTKNVTEDDAQSYYEKNKGKFKGDFISSREKIVKDLQERERKAAEAAFYERLRQATTLQVFFSGPGETVHQIAIKNRPSKGNVNAPVTIVEFTDFQCPDCARAQKLIKTLMDEYGDKIKVVSRNFPLQMHEHAFRAAEAAEAAFEQGKYWEYIELLYSNQKALEVDKLKEYASRLSLDQARFDAALNSGKFSDLVQRDIEEGLKLGIYFTPTIYVNGRRVRGEDYESLKSAIEAALRAVER